MTMTDNPTICPPDTAGDLTPEQRATLGQALADAITCREASASDSACADRDLSPSGLCLDHEADLDRMDAYVALARVLGIEVPS